MTRGQTIAQKTSAADKSIGFDYQYYYFLEKLLNLKTGQSVGLEVFEDVHVTVSASLQLLFQLKHTTSIAADGKPVNLTSLDDDLWKTMSNWSKVIKDVNDGRTQKDHQLDFIKKTEFHLVTNKSWCANNKFLSNISNFLDDLCEFSEVLSTVRELENQTNNAEIKQYIVDVLALDNEVMKAFFRKLRFQLNETEIMDKIRRSIFEKAIDEKDIEHVFNRLDSNIRNDNFITTIAGKPICISYEEFMKRYKKIFVTVRNNKLNYSAYQPTLPNDLLNQRFVSQLLHINDLQAEQLELIAEYTTKKLKLARNLYEWNQRGELVSDEISDFHNEVKNQWQNKFRKTFRYNKSPADVLLEAVNLLDDLREKRFTIDDLTLPTELSNGELYHLSDSGEIGWHPDWEKL